MEMEFSKLSSMKLFNRIYFFISIILMSCSTGDTGPHAPTKSINYGYNIVVAFDLSNRILASGRYSDPKILKLTTDKLKTLFQKSINVGVNGKFYFTTINENDFEGF